jgi:site-specific recombinase XerD
MTFALVQQSNTKLARAATWVELNPEERKRRAVEAARDRDATTLWELCEAWLTLYSAARNEISQHTLKAYRTALRQWLYGMEGQGLLQVDQDSARLWVERLEVSPSSSGVKIAGVRAVYAALRWAGATTLDPMQDIKPARDTTSKHEKRDKYSDLEIEALLGVASDPRDQMMVLLGGHGGLRVAEMCALKPSHYNPNSKRLKFKGKGGKTRSVRVSNRLAKLLEQCQPAGETYLGFGDDWARIRMRKLCALAGVRYKAVHSLRHSTGSRIYQQTKDLQMVAAHLGHSGIETAAIYAKWDKQELEAAVVDW